MSMQAALDALETVKAARVAYRARLEALGYTHITVHNYGDSWSGWVHPDYLAVVKESQYENGHLDKDIIEDNLKGSLPDGAIVEDVWFVSCDDTRPGRYLSIPNPWD